MSNIQFICTLYMTGTLTLLTPAQAPNTPSPAPPNPKKDPQTPQISPLEKRLQDMGSIRVDGSDKFFGMENVSASVAGSIPPARPSPY